MNKNYRRSSSAFVESIKSDKEKDAVFFNTHFIYKDRCINRMRNGYERSERLRRDRLKRFFFASFFFVNRR